MNALKSLSPEVVSFLGDVAQAVGTLIAALIVGVCGALIARRHSRERDRQDRESQWRTHAIELTKLDLERKLKTSAPDGSVRLRPSILDFIANYRDLQELGARSPRDLYILIEEQRIQDSSLDGEDGPAEVELEGRT